jgi:hypothetical protein
MIQTINVYNKHCTYNVGYFFININYKLKEIYLSLGILDDFLLLVKDIVFDLYVFINLIG